MKKFLLLPAIFFSCSFLHAAMDNADYWREFRSTQTCSAVTNFLVSTGPIFLANVVISSPSAGAEFKFFNSSTTDLSVARSTSLAYTASVANTVYPITTTLTKGFLFTTAGSACIRFNWDYLWPQAGKEYSGKNLP